jgi:hypothetical protein
VHRSWPARTAAAWALAVTAVLASALLACSREQPPAAVTGPVAVAAGEAAASDAPPAGPDPYPEDAYPADISPPPGLQYPCALEALPRDPVGIPAGDRRYINHTYTRILRATQAKLLVLNALYNDTTHVAEETARYQRTVAGLLNRLRTEPPPRGLDAFRDDVVAAVELQGAFFARAAPLRLSGGSMQEVMTLREGREASGRLLAAWAKMAARYPSWDTATKDSIYHHLCALDLF